MTKTDWGDTEREKYYRNLHLEIRGLRVDPGNIHVSVCDGLNKMQNPNLMQDKRKPCENTIFWEFIVLSHKIAMLFSVETKNGFACSFFFRCHYLMSTS